MNDVANDIAVVGLDCRFPKADDARALWRLLLDGAEGIDEIDSARWNAAVLRADGVINHSAGGFIANADAFDNDFFGITPREAAAMDPQQRLLLQTTWRAIEDATLDPRSQAGSATGVFVGVMANEWAHLHMGDYREITAQDGSGNGYFMTANRLSYQLDLRGPSLAVDTACSSSLVAIHLAAQSLRNGECDQAIAAGVNLVLTPALNVFYTKAGLASPDGRCKPFSGSADGIGRGEGVAVVVLLRLEDALSAGLPIYAVIKGSAVNSDGRSNGITAPNRWAQQQVTATAYKAAGVTPAQLSFIEAHGTGTLLGDMIEAKALADLHRSDRGEPCAIGSIKGNLGHTEGAAGIAGFIKAVLSLHHGVVPPSRFAESGNAQLRLTDGGLRLLSEPMELSTGTTYAGVSSFGLGGTNCHVVVATAPETEPLVLADDHRAGILTLSADCPEALRRNAIALAADIENSDASLATLCRSTNRIKASGKSRIALVVSDRAEAVAALRDQAFEIGNAAGMSAGWLFSGQGTQYAGMATALYESSQPFRDALDEAEAALQPHIGMRIRQVMDDDRIDRTEFAQPAIFALQYAQALALLRLGAEPAWLLGHSIGEYAAAAIAGVFSLDDACRLVVARGRLMQRLPGGGAMLAVRAGLADLDHWGGLPIDVAAVNGPNEVVLSGSVDAIEDAAQALAAYGVTTRRLNVSHAFHSQLMEPMTAEFASIAADCAYQLPAYPIFSTVHGRLLGDDEPMDADYWTAHVGATVRFADATTEAMQAEPTHLVEFGAKRTLGPMIARSHEGAPHAMAVAAGATEVVAALYRGGLNPGWNLLYPNESLTIERLSGYSFSTANRFWIKEQNVTPPTSATTSTPTPATTPKDSTMDNLIALFREQAAVLAAYGRGAAPVEPHVDAAPELMLQADVTGIVRAEIARISGFPDRALRSAQTITGDLGFDSIMVTDLFAGLTRRIPGSTIDASGFGQDSTIDDVIAMAGGQAKETVVATPQDAAVKPQTLIAEFEEVKALADRKALIEAAGIDNPYFVVNDGVTGATSIVDGKEVVNFSSFNYLGMSGHPAVADAMADAVRRWGSSCSASRILAGEKPVHRDLELELARLLGTEDALTLVNGHATNVTVIGHLLGEGDLVIHDSLAHDSIVQGCKLSGATRRPFPHNDPGALDELLTNIRHQYRRVLIIIEGVYSQDGDIADLPYFIEVKRKHGALLMIDEAHSIGVLGATGGGIGQHFDVDRADVELWSGTMSKALAGCGGYVAGSRELIEFLKYTTPGFIFSGGMAPAIAAAALAAIRVMHCEPEHLSHLKKMSTLFLELARDAGLDTGISEGTPVVPCIVGSSVTAMKLSNALLRRGINANPILYPAVPEDEARLRFFITSCHSEEQIRFAVKVLAEELALLSEGA